VYALFQNQKDKENSKHRKKTLLIERDSSDREKEVKAVVEKEVPSKLIVEVFFESVVIIFHEFQIEILVHDLIEFKDNCQKYRHRIHELRCMQL
jgi:hypothetical protein